MKKKRFTEQQIIGFLKESEAGCRKHGFSDAAFYKWRGKYGGMQVSEAKRLRELEAEKGKLPMKLASHVLLAAARHLPGGYWRLIRFAAANDPALWDIRIPLAIGGSIRADLRESVFAPIWREGCIPHQRELDAVLMSHVRGGLAFDVGANVGYTAILLSRLADRVVALEPGPRAFRLLARTASENIVPLELAASDAEGFAAFHESEYSDVSSIAVTGERRVRTVTLDALAREYGMPTIVKIDVEGHEPAVLRGASAVLAARPIVVFEALSPNALRDSAALMSEHRIARIGQGNDYLAVPR